jgi:hypothetical protein
VLAVSVAIAVAQSRERSGVNEAVGLRVAVRKWACVVSADSEGTSGPDRAPHVLAVGKRTHRRHSLRGCRRSCTSTAAE